MRAGYADRYITLKTFAGASVARLPSIDGAARAPLTSMFTRRSSSVVIFSLSTALGAGGASASEGRPSLDVDATTDAGTTTDVATETTHPPTSSPT
ncbi:MAG: hypothetical protein ACHREM_24350 [Polyangiales bacterium]